MRLALFPILALMCCVPLVHGQDADAPKSLDELRQRIEKVIADTKTPALGIALVNREGPYWVAGLGKADLKSDKPANEDTLFRIGSISKMFAALSILKLAEEGKLSLDDKVRERAPEVEFENPWEDTHPVRIVHLLEHTTGWDDIHLPEYALVAPDTMSNKDALAFHPHSRISRWMPGTRHAYCNAGSAVAAFIVEKVTGQRYEDYVAENFFAPLGMSSTSYFKTALYDERGATLYMGTQPQKYWEIIFRPAGSINSSARDMAKLVQFMLLRGSTPSVPIVSPQSIDRMEVPHSTLGNALGITGGYGLANYTTGYKNWNVAFHGHDGGVLGGVSQLSYVKELGQGYVIMINSGNGAALGQLSELIRSYLLRDIHQAERPAADLPAPFKAIDGYYQPINPRQELSRFLVEPLSVMKISHDDKFLHRSPLLGGWVSDDRLSGERTLIDAWHGLPAVAIVEDPLAGPAVQINSDLMRRIPAWQVFSKFVVIALVIVMTVIGFVTLGVWGARRGKKKTTDDRVWLRLSPLFATMVLIAFLLVLSSAGALLAQAGTISLLSVTIFLLSLIYPAVVVFGVVQLARTRNRANRNFPFWFAAGFVFLHLLVAGYLAVYGVIGVRTWA